MNNDTENVLYNILSGKSKIKLKQLSLEIFPPSYEDLAEAQNLYKSIYRHLYLLGGYSQSDIVDMLVMRNIWSIDSEDELEKLPDIINNAKLDIYETYTRFGDIEHKRGVIQQLNKRYGDLLNKKSQFHRFTVEGIAEYHKVCYLLCCGSNIDYYNTDINLDQLYCQYMNNIPNEEEIRNIAKSNDWRDYWRGIKLGYRIFGDILTRPQYSLLSWSQFYDNIYEHSESPSEDVINDNDLLDGWCIFQKNKRKSEEKKRFGDKYGNANEVFIPVSTPEQAAKVNAMNEGKSKLIKRQRESLIAQRGTILEQDLPDGKARIREQAMQEFKNKGKR